MGAHTLNLILADDDLDDQMLFGEALKELPVRSHLTTAKDGIELMAILHRTEAVLPDALFLDLNMPRKTGEECLQEIKRDARLRKLPVIIYSTSYNKEIMDRLYETGAYHYICKPGDFSALKRVVLTALTYITTDRGLKPPHENFVIET